MFRCARIESGSDRADSDTLFTDACTGANLGESHFVRLCLEPFLCHGMTIRPPTFRFDRSSVLPLALIGVTVMVAGWCMETVWSTPLANGYALRRRDFSTGVVIDRNGATVHIGSGDSGVSRSRIGFGIASGELDSGEWFLLDTATGRAEVFDDSRRWSEALAQAGAIPDSISAPGPSGSGAGIVVIQFLLSITLFPAGVVTAVIAMMRADRIRQLIEGNPQTVVTNRDRRRIRHCPGCGYDLNGVESTPCPECARIAHWHPIETLHAPPRLTPLRFSLIAAAGLFPNVVAGVWLTTGRHSWSGAGSGLRELTVFGLFIVPGVMTWLLFVSACGRMTNSAQRRGWLVSLLAIAWLWPMVYLASWSLR